MDELSGPVDLSGRCLLYRDVDPKERFANYLFPLGTDHCTGMRQLAGALVISATEMVKIDITARAGLERWTAACLAHLDLIEQEYVFDVHMHAKEHALPKSDRWFTPFGCNQLQMKALKRRAEAYDKALVEVEDYATNATRHLDQALSGLRAWQFKRRKFIEERKYSLGMTIVALRAFIGALKTQDPAPSHRPIVAMPA